MWSSSASPLSFTLDESNNQFATASASEYEEQEDRNAVVLLVDTKPKRPLTAYNFFFQSERLKLLKTHGKCGFSSMGKIIAKKWVSNDIDPQERAKLMEMAWQEKLRYSREMQEYKCRKVTLTKKANKKSSAAHKKTQVRKQRSQGTQPSVTMLAFSNQQDQQKVFPCFFETNMPTTVSSDSLSMHITPSRGSMVSSYIRREKSIRYGYSIMPTLSSIMPNQEHHQIEDLEQGDPMAVLPVDTLASHMLKRYRHSMEDTNTDDDFDSALSTIFQDDPFLPCLLKWS